MFNKKEIYAIISAIIVISLAISFLEVSILPRIVLSVFIILLVNILAKKIVSFYLDSEIEIRPWEVSRYGFRRHRYFKKPIAAGMILPIALAIISLGNLFWMASLVFEVKPKKYRAAKHHGLYSFSEMTESHIGLIAASGVMANLTFAIIAYMIGFSEFARLSIYYAFFSILPFSDLDGNKIFFGSRNLILWSFLAALVLIGLGYAFFLI